MDHRSVADEARRAHAGYAVESRRTQRAARLPHDSAMNELATVAAPSPERHAALERVWTRPPGVIGWLSSTNHKEIGLRYIVTALVFFILAGLLALMMRLQL